MEAPHWKRAFQIAQEMERCHLTKSEMAHRMRTTLSTLERAAAAVGKRLKVELSA